MIRTTITPTEENIILPVPENYIGKRVEVIMFDVEEVTTEKTTSKVKPSALRGFLSVETAEALQQHVNKSRQEWDT